MTKHIKELSPVMVTPEGELALQPLTLVELESGEDSLLADLITGTPKSEFDIYAAKSAKKKAEEEEDDDDDSEDDSKDDWEKGEEEEEEEWDPDFDEFDLPKSGKKAGKGKGGSDEDDDVKIDDDMNEFDDLFGDGGDDFDDDDDY